MSDRPCNYCTFQALKRRARADGDIVETRPSSFMNGTDVFVRGPKEKPRYERDNNPQWVCWFMELPKHCAC